MERKQDASVFVFDEPTIGLHPLDVQALLQVFDRLVSKGATVINKEKLTCDKLTVFKGLRRI